LGRPLVEKIVGKKSLEKIDNLTKEYGLTTLFFLRIFQGSIHDFLSIAVGLTDLRFTPYIIVSGLALIPGTALWYYLSSLVDTPAQFTILTTLFTITFSSLYIGTRFLVKKWLLKYKKMQH